jgi:hypothetical protein
MGGSSGGGELSPGGGSAEMIGDGRSNANRKVLIKGVSENLLPTGEPWGLGRPGFPVPAPGTISFQVRPRSRSSRICCVEAG